MMANTRRAQRYASDIMAERRQRILREARELLAAGEANLTINRLCERAGVAARTIYRAFGDREGVIHAAVAEHMGAIAAFLSVTPLRGDIASVFRDYDWITAELFRGEAFARVLIGFFFSQSSGEAALASLSSVPYARIRAWLQHADEQGYLAPGLDQERIARHQVDTEYAVFSHWAAGRIGGDRVCDELKVNFLMTTIVAATGDERERLVALLADFHRCLREARAS